MTPEALRNFAANKLRDSDDYPCIVVQLDEGWRVIESMDGRYLTLQRRIVRERYRGRWRNVEATSSPLQMRVLCEVLTDNHTQLNKVYPCA